MDFAIIHFSQVALFYRKMGVPFCILPSANDCFPDEGAKLRIASQHKDCKFVTYQSIYHNNGADDSPFVHEGGYWAPQVFSIECLMIFLCKKGTKMHIYSRDYLVLHSTKFRKLSSWPDCIRGTTHGHRMAIAWPTHGDGLAMMFPAGFQADSTI